MAATNKYLVGSNPKYGSKTQLYWVYSDMKHRACSKSSHLRGLNQQILGSFCFTKMTKILDQNKTKIIFFWAWMSHFLTVVSWVELLSSDPQGQSLGPHSNNSKVSLADYRSLFVVSHWPHGGGVITRKIDKGDPEQNIAPPWREEHQTNTWV